MSASVAKMPVKQNEAEGDEILTLEEAAAFLKVKRRTMYEWVGRNAIPYLRAGKLIRFERRALLAWMKEQAEAGH